MAADSPKVEFALGSEVSPGHFFKSSFARSFVTAALTKSLDFDHQRRGESGGGGCGGGNSSSSGDNSPTTIDEGRTYAGDAVEVGNSSSNDAVMSAVRPPSFVASSPTRRETPAAPGPGDFYSLVNFGAGATAAVDRRPDAGAAVVSSIWGTSVAAAAPGAVAQSLAPTTTEELDELERLRKQCQTLMEEKQRLQASLSSQPAHVQVIDNVCLQSQVDTLQWQLKQSEANRQMYRSMMEQVVRFLERARRSLDIIHEKSASKSPTACGGGNGGGVKANGVSNNSGSKDKPSRVPRSRSVHAVHAEHLHHHHAVGQLDAPGHQNGGGSSLSASLSCASSTTSSSSSASSSSRFSRAKSVAQIASSCSPSASPSSILAGGLKDFSWSVLRRNEQSASTAAAHQTRIKSPQPAQSAQDLSKHQQEGAAGYRRPKQSELDPDDIPPEKLSQEAFRLLRTVQSLLVMRDPDLARLTSAQDLLNLPPSSLDHHNHHHHHLHHNHHLHNNQINNNNHHQHHHHHHHHHNNSNPDTSQLSLQSSFTNSTLLPDASLLTTATTPTTSGCSSSDRGTDASTDDESNRTLFCGSEIGCGNSAKGELAASSHHHQQQHQLQHQQQQQQQQLLLMCPRTRQSLGAASIDSVSSKTTEDEETTTTTMANGAIFSQSEKRQEQRSQSEQQQQQQKQQYSGKYVQMPSSSTPHGRKIKKLDRREMHFKSLRDWALGNSSGSVVTPRTKPSASSSVSSAEDESGFSSMSSFQEVGLPQMANGNVGAHHQQHQQQHSSTGIKSAVGGSGPGGCHTEVGLPEVPLEKIRHRRWSSTPAEFKALFKRHSGSYGSSGGGGGGGGTQTTAESLSVWV